MCVQIPPARRYGSCFLPGLLAVAASIGLSTPAPAQSLAPPVIGGTGVIGGTIPVQRRVVIGGNRQFRREPVIGGDVVLGPRADYDVGLNIRFARRPRAISGYYQRDLRNSLGERTDGFFVGAY